MFYGTKIRYVYNESGDDNYTVVKIPNAEQYCLIYRKKISTIFN